MASSKLGNGASYQMKVPASANANQANGNFMQKRISNGGPNTAADEQSKSSRFAMNYSGKDDQYPAAAQSTLPNINVNTDNYGQKDQAN